MDSLALLFIAVVVVLMFVSLAWHSSRSATLLRAWAEANGLRILRSENRYMFRGPFSWTTAKGQAVYRVTVEDKAGKVRGGWVRCGGGGWA